MIRERVQVLLFAGLLLVEMNSALKLNRRIGLFHISG